RRDERGGYYPRRCGGQRGGAAHGAQAVRRPHIRMTGWPGRSPADIHETRHPQIGGDEGMKIAFLGYGEAARAFHEGLRRPGLSFIAYDILLERGDEAMRSAMLQRGAEVAD